MTAREFGALGATSKISFVKDSACAHFSVAQATIGDLYGPSEVHQ